MPSSRETPCIVNENIWTQGTRWKAMGRRKITFSGEIDFFALRNLITNEMKSRRTSRLWKFYKKFCFWKLQVILRTGHEALEGEWRYSSTLSITTTLDGVGGQRYAPAALSPGKTRCLLCRSFGGPQGQSGRVRKISPLPGLDPRTAQPVANRYTVWAILANLECT